MSLTINGISVPDSAMARQATELVRDTESDLLFHHSSRVYYWAALAGQQRKLAYDPELLYVGCLFHDMGLTHDHCSCDKRFEVDGADAAAEFLRGHGVSRQDIDRVWTAIALHTTPGIPEYMHPLIALVTAGVEMDVLGINYQGYDATLRERVVELHPRGANFKEAIIQAFYDGIRHKPDSTFGNVKADVLADKEPSFVRCNFCSLIRRSMWPA